MKTSVVLLALATAALAAPALHEETFEDVHHIAAKSLDAFTREMKSTLESGSNPSPGSPVNLPSSQVSELGVSGRTFNLKKPIIIKKKIGSSYQVYRDSDEEKLDSPPCRKQVRVNLCDEQSLAKSADGATTSTIEDPNLHMTEDDMKHSIMLAKEAVENLQKDMRKIEHKPAKSATWKHGDSESDAELHHDIEKARQALEHIQNNFEDLETSNSHTTLKGAEIVEDVSFPMEKTEEERLAQWKDAIESIQRNVELVRNIEESFKSTHDVMPHIEETSTKDINKHEPLAKDMRVVENVEMKDHASTFDDSEHSKLEKSSEHHELKTDLTEKDMMESASMVSSSKLQNLDHSDKGKDAHEKLHHGEHAVDTMTLDHLSQNMDTLALKEERKTESDLEKIEKLDKTGLEESLLKNQRDANNGEAAAKMIEMKSAEHITDKHSKLVKNEDETHKGHHAMEQLKEADDFATVGLTQSSADMKSHKNVHHHKDLVAEKSAPHEAMSSDSLAIDQHTVIKGQPEMKSAEDSKNMHHQIDHSQMRWAQDKHFNSEMGLVKSAAETHQAMDHMQNIHDEHHHAHHVHQHPNPHHLNAPSHGHPRQQEHFMTHGKSADMDNTMQSNYFMNMRNSDNMGQEGQRFKWRPAHAHHHDSARTAYGASASAPAAGAVGLFPNANVGSCGIPLLLSCNPSVVSGSLAKAHPAPYSAPAYRTEDDFNFHSKRDVKKTEKFVETLNKTPTNSILKTSSVLVAKH